MSLSSAIICRFGLSSSRV